jgi:hypothetical protein
LKVQSKKVEGEEIEGAPNVDDKVSSVAQSKVINAYKGKNIENKHYTEDNNTFFFVEQRSLM